MNNVPGGAGGDGPRHRQARREGHADLHQRQRPAARRAGVLPHLRAHEQELRPADLGAPDAHREVRRLSAEQKSKYEIWWLFGWPYETSAFMARMVFSRHVRQAAEAEDHHPPPRRDGAVLRQPHRLRHGPVRQPHLGRGLRGAAQEHEEAAGRLLQDVLRRHLGQRLRRAAIRCGLDFFGSKHVLFGTDCPFDPQGGPLFIRETIKALDG